MSAIAAAAIGAAGAIGGSLIGAHGATSAAKTQAQAAQQAEQLQQQEWQQQQANLAPWLKAGTGALGNLVAGTQPGGQYTQAPFSATGLAQYALHPNQFTPTGMATQALQPSAFQAPTAEQAAAMPGYQFAFDQGLQALQRSQAATGITGGGAAKAAQQYGQGLASTNYQQAYNQALSNYSTNQAAAQNALANQTGLYGTQLGAAQNALASQTGLYNTQQQGINNAYNRIAGIAGMGENANQQLNAAGQNYASNVGNLMTSSGAAQAAGQMGAANAWGQGLAGVGNAAMNYALMGALFGQGTPASNPGTALTANEYVNAPTYGQIANEALAGIPTAPIAAAPYVAGNQQMALAPYLPQSSYGS